MLRLIVFDGGLGNQMFQYAFYLKLKQMHPSDTFVFNVNQSMSCHYGYELDHIFGLDSSAQRLGYKTMRRCLPNKLEKLNTVRQKVCLEYSPCVFQKRHLFYTRYVGFWQSEKYFSDITDTVRASFCFDESLLNDSTRSLSVLMEKGNYVSVHIRRGDYLMRQSYFGLCSEEYYCQAMEYITKKVEKPIFVFFSDEIEWARAKFNHENAVFVDWNHGEESWQDMYLMTRCRHNIIANSSFSWWGGWLNSNKGKIVVAPKKWFEFTPNYDVLPADWIMV